MLGEHFNNCLAVVGSVCRKNEWKINYYYLFDKNNVYAKLLLAPPREMFLKAPAFGTSHFFCLAAECGANICGVGGFMIGNDGANFFDGHDL